MKIRKLYKYSALMAIIVIFSATGAIAEEASPPTTCDCFDLGIAVMTDGDGNFPVKSTCVDPENPSETVPCWIYEYTSNIFGGLYAQTVPGLGPETFFVYPPPDSFSSIEVSDPAVGTTIQKACFGQNVYERRVINFTSAPSGTPRKFGYSANQPGVGWTTLYFKKGNDFCSCPIAGPDFGEDRYIKPVIKWIKYGETRVRFEINFQNCTYKAFQETDANGDPLDPNLYPNGEIELTQFPIDNITISINGVAGPSFTSDSPGKCDENSWSYGTGTCSVFNLGGFCVKIPFGCTP
jgi:hypothetical protein